MVDCRWGRSVATEITDFLNEHELHGLSESLLAHDYNLGFIQHTIKGFVYGWDKRE